MQKMNLIILFSFLLISNLALSQLVFANLYIKPAKQGIYRLKLYPFMPATLTKTFEVKNLYDFPLGIILSPSDNFIDIMEIQEQQFTLQPNESKDVEYTVTIKEPGTYSGGIVIRSIVEGLPSNIVFQTDLTIFATKSLMIPEALLVVIILAIVLPILFLIFKKFRSKKRSRK